MKKFPAVLLALACLVGAAPTAAAQPLPTDRQQPRQRFIVRWDSAGAQRVQARGIERRGERVRRHFSHVFNGAVVEMSPVRAAALRRSPHVLSVEPDARISVAGVQTNPPGNLDRIDQRTTSPSRSYTSTFTGKGVKVYVVDTGLNLASQDLAGRIVKGPNFVEPGKAPADCQGHGSHVTGIVAGTRFGVAKQATVVPVKVLDCEGGGYVSDTVAAMDWVVANHTGGPAVLNLSLDGDRSAAIDAAVQRALNDGVTVVTASGNIEEGEAPGTSHDACNYSPSRVAGALTVANASNSRRPYWTYTGRCVDIFAPGVSVLSVGIGSATATATMSGSSMAAPHVSGAAALVLQARPTWTPAQVGTQILNQSTRNVMTGLPTGTPNRLLYTLGGITPGALERIGRPTISGTPRVGQVLTANPGVWGSGTVALGYQWYRISSTGRSTAIPGARARTYRLTTADRGSKVMLRVTGHKLGYAARTNPTAPTSTVR
ncbi:S8 family serine peptidase [Luteococcus peritonei]|uniref:S8 family serine peptidase n=1 Tax=Luteococcus peritonei TaxID=88874 RepID=A0ABW4RY59_9ACTN